MSRFLKQDNQEQNVTAGFKSPNIKSSISHLTPLGASMENRLLGLWELAKEEA